jgi:hypothetical protein
VSDVKFIDPIESTDTFEWHCTRCGDYIVSRKRPACENCDTPLTPGGPPATTNAPAGEAAREINGWVSGSAYDFLGLSVEEAAYVELKFRLGHALTRHRESRGLTQCALALMLRTSQSRVSKMERGDPSTSVDLTLRALIRLGVQREEIAAAMVFDAAALHPDGEEVKG